MKCKICGSQMEGDPLVIENVPDSTFNISEKTITLRIEGCQFCGVAQLVDVPLSPDFDIARRSIGVSSFHREEKKRQLWQFVQSNNLCNASIVEVGCGDGQFLEIMREVGANNILGINSNSAACKGFDCFVTFHYLEHLPDPVAFVTFLFNIIKPGGIGLIEVPNYDFIDKDNIWLEFTKDHRFYYRKRTLCYLLSKCGFDIESIEGNGLCLTATVRKPHVGTFSFMRNQIDQDIESFRKLVSRTDGKFSVYGAGHYSQLLLNLVGMKPVRIFDSNSQKCGHKICGVVVEPGDNARNCDNIIVICGIYNNEVREMLLGRNVIKWG